MIILLDIENKCLKLYKNDGVFKIDFNNILQIYNYVTDDDPIYYVTNVIETDIKSIISLVSKITGVEMNNSIVEDINIKYLHSKSKGPLIIPDPNSLPEEQKTILKFENYYDIKVLDENMAKLINKYSVLKAAIRNGNIEIINGIQKNKIFFQSNKEKEKKKITQDKKDKVLSSIISDKPAAELAQGISDEDDDVETIEITSSNINSRTEEENIIKRFNIKEL